MTGSNWGYIGNWAAGVLANAMAALASTNERNGSRIGDLILAIVRYPAKTVAVFLLAHLLVFRIAALAKNPIRRTISGVGLFLAVLLAMCAGTYLGTALGALFTASQFGITTAIGFLIGTSFSVTLSIVFSVIVLNATSWIFLHISNEDVIEYLRNISKWDSK